MLMIWGACHATGQVVTHDQDLTNATAKTVLSGSHLAGLALVFGLIDVLRTAADRYRGPASNAPASPSA